MSDNKVWISNALSHQNETPVPFNFSFSPPARKKMEEYFGTTLIEETLNYPIRMNAPASIEPLYADPAIYDDTIRDEFGVIWSTNRLDRGSPIGPVLKEPSLSGYEFPDPAAGYRFSELGDWCKENEEHFAII